MFRFLASLEYLGARALRSPGAWLLALIALGLGPLLSAFQQIAPIGDPDTTAAELAVLLLATLGACWSLHQMGRMALVRRVEDFGQCALIDACLSAGAALVLVGLASGSLHVVALETPWAPALWGCVKLGALAFGLRYATVWPASMLVALVWGAPQLGLTAVTATLGLQTTPQPHVEALYLVGLLLLALAAPQRRTSS